MQIAFFLLLLSYVIPILGQPWISVQNEILAFFCVMTLTFKVANKPHIKVALNTPICVLLIMQGMMLLQIMVGNSYYLGDFVNWSLYLIASCLCLIVGQNISAEGKTSGNNLGVMLAYTLLCAGLVSVMIAIFQNFNLYMDSEWIVRTAGTRAGANLGQPNHFATLSSIALVSLMYLSEKVPLKKLIIYPLASVLVLGIVLSNSRTGLLELIFISLGGYYFFRKIRGNYISSPLYLLVAYWLMLLLWQVWSSQTFSSIEHNNLVDKGASLGTRSCVWNDLIDAGVSRFWLGWGFGQTYAAQQSAATNLVCGDSYTYAHNFIIELFVGMGVLGLVLSFGLIFWLCRVTKKIRTIEEGYCIGVIGVVAIHSQLEFPYAYAYFLFPVMLMIGWITSMQQVSSDRVILISRRAILALLCSISITGLIWCFDYYRIQEDFRRARFEMLRIGQVDPEYKPPQIYLLTQLNEAIVSIRIMPSRDIPIEQLELLARASARYPWPVLASRYATALALHGDTVAAAKQLRIIKSVYGERIYDGLLQKWSQAKPEDLTQFNIVLEKLND